MCLGTWTWKGADEPGPGTAQMVGEGRTGNRCRRGRRGRNESAVVAREPYDRTCPVPACAGCGADVQPFGELYGGRCLLWDSLWTDCSLYYRTRSFGGLLGGCAVLQVEDANRLVGQETRRLVLQHRRLRVRLLSRPPVSQPKMERPPTDKVGGRFATEKPPRYRCPSPRVTLSLQARTSLRVPRLSF